jgi:hypothetical protein
MRGELEAPHRASGQDSEDPVNRRPDPDVCEPSLQRPDISASHAHPKDPAERRCSRRSVCARRFSGERDHRRNQRHERKASDAPRERWRVRAAWHGENRSSAARGAS